jgi:uridylate kinase
MPLRVYDMHEAGNLAKIIMGSNVGTLIVNEES